MDDLSAYTVLFDLSTRAYQPPWFSLIVLMHFAFAAAAMYARARRTGIQIAAAVGFCFALIFALTITWGHWSESQSLQRAMAEGRMNIAEGRVENFEPGSPGGNIPQTFSVNGVSFEIRANSQTPAFRHTASRGGPDLGGRCVRIGYVTDNTFTPLQDKIVWLGIRRSGDCPR